MSTMITISPRVPIAKLERIAKSRIDRHGAVAFGEMTADFRQQAHLRRLADHLGTDPDLRVSFVQRTDGVTQMTAMPADARHAGCWGDPKGVPEEDPDVTVEFLDGDPWWDEPETPD